MTTQVTIHPVIKRSVVITGHKTSLSLEEPFWNGLCQIAARENTTIGAVVSRIDRQRPSGNLSSAIRQIVLAEALAGPAEQRP